MLNKITTVFDARNHKYYHILITMNCSIYILHYWIKYYVYTKCNNNININNNNNSIINNYINNNYYYY